MKNIFCFIVLIVSFTGFAVSAQENGYASWYGEEFHGRKTANGEIFNTFDFTAAHKTLPFNTIVRVTNLKNGKTVDVRINDRGPFVEGRIIDLSKAAAEKIDLIKTGTAFVKIEKISGSENTAIIKPEKLYKIQIASFSQRDYAENLAAKLSNQGINSIFEDSGSGITRVIVTGIKENELESIKQKLYSLGYTNILIKTH